MARFVKRRLANGARILDIGCGVGANAFWLAQEGYQVTAIDQSAEAIQSLRCRMNKPQWQSLRWIDHRTLDATDLFYNDDSFDAVIDVCCLQHVEDIGVALGGISRVLKPKGWFFSVIASMFHSAAAMPKGLYYKLWQPHAIRMHWQAEGLDVVSILHAQHQDDDYGDIGHWLVTARKDDRDSEKGRKSEIDSLCRAEERETGMGW